MIVLSNFAGAAYELNTAELVSPYDPDAVAEALQTALGMPLGERLERWEATITSLRGESFLEATAANWRSLRTRHQCSRSRYSRSSTICSRPLVRCYIEIISGAEMIHA
ncbi:trehalose-6-phosphate synthase [Bradyrhizobium ottawaense]|uniref:trehalose-6-phosphate synthase n=1 Tax=Bradyrhizobium ottawaense TaxID=931866 RepID=UPI003F9EDEF6